MLAKQEMYIELGRKKVESSPKDAHALAELGNQYSEMHEYANAAASYRDSLKLDMSNPIVLKDLGGSEAEGRHRY